MKQYKTIEEFLHDPATWGKAPTPPAPTPPPATRPAPLAPTPEPLPFKDGGEKESTQ